MSIARRLLPLGIFLVGLGVLVGAEMWKGDLRENADLKLKRESFVEGCTYIDNSKGNHALCSSRAVKQYPWE